MKAIFTRLHALIIKWIGVKTTIFTIATVLKFTGNLNDLWWFACALSVISIRMFEKFITTLAGKWNVPIKPISSLFSKDEGASDGKGGE